MATDLTVQEWYTALVEDCRVIITEAVFNSRWALVEGYHCLGERIVTDKNLKWHAKGNHTYLTDLSNKSGIGLRDLYRAIAFYEKYPSLDTVPEGKNISWNKIVTQYLPSPKTETPTYPDGKYQLIYADPPWKYDFSKSDSREIENQYPTMELSEICALPVSKWADSNCVLFMWATSPKLDQAFGVIQSWGFTYKTCMVWVKDKIGMGYYARQQHELLLIATIGDPATPEPENRPSSVVQAPRGEHSHKPVEFYELLERMYPKLKKIELFSRSPRDGWKAWGNQVNNGN